MRLKPILMFSAAALAAWYWSRPKPKPDQWQPVDEADQVMKDKIAEVKRRVRFHPDLLYGE